MNCPASYRQCGKGCLRADLAIDCAVENKRKAKRMSPTSNAKNL